MTVASHQNQRFRVCAVCGRRHASTYGFRNALRAIGIPGDKAVPACVIQTQRKFDAQRTKRGRS